MNIFKKLTILSLIFFTTQCAYVDKEISKSQEKEKSILEQYLGKKSSSLKERLGEPTNIIFNSYLLFIVSNINISFVIIPSRYSMSPPNLSTYAPIFNII